MTRALRESLAAKGVGGEDGFRLRGGEVTRLEGFSDAVFAFAVTLLVVSLEVPRTFNELVNAMRGFPAFAVCFTLLIVIWQEHYVFFRRYGLQNGVILWLNAALLFVMLFYVYPLKFLFTIVLAPLTGTPMVVAGAHGGSESVIEPSQLPQLFLIYGAGIIALYVLLACLFVHAYRRRRELALTPLEEFDTRASIRSHLLAAGVAALSIVIALVVPLHLVGLAGLGVLPLRSGHGDPRELDRTQAAPTRERRLAPSLLIGEVQAQCDREEDRHLATGDGLVHAIGPGTSAGRDSCGGQRLDEPEERVAGRHIARKTRDTRRRTHLQLVDHARGEEDDVGRRSQVELDVVRVAGVVDRLRRGEVGGLEDATGSPAGREQPGDHRGSALALLETRSAVRNEAPRSQ